MLTVGHRASYEIPAMFWSRQAGMRILARAGRATFVLTVAVACAGCGGGTQASSPPKLDVPTPTQASPSAASTATGDASATASAAPLPPAQPKDDVPERLRAVVVAGDRSDDDRALDVGRRPAELLAFAGITEGMRVAEIGAWKGYTAELLARAVGDAGRVYAQDPKAFDKWTKDAWAGRAKNAPLFARITRVEREFDDPLPAEAKGLDAVFVVLFYHDTVWLGIDRAKMNRALFAALKSGGEYIVVDHRAKPGAGTSVAKTLHRIEESVVRTEVEQAGFKLAAAADFLKNPTDTYDWNDSDEAPKEKRGTSDRFVLKYVKP